MDDDVRRDISPGTPSFVSRRGPNASASFPSGQRQVRSLQTCGPDWDLVSDSSLELDVLSRPDTDLKMHPICHL